MSYSKTCVKRALSKRPKNGFQDQLSLNAGQKYCRMLLGEHSAILLASIKLPFVIKIFVLSIFEWPFHTGFTVFWLLMKQADQDFHFFILTLNPYYPLMKSRGCSPGFFHVSTIPSVCLSVCLLVCLSVCASRLRS